MHDRRYSLETIGYECVRARVLNRKEARLEDLPIIRIIQMRDSTKDVKDHRLAQRTGLEPQMNV